MVMGIDGSLDLRKRSVGVYGLKKKRRRERIGRERRERFLDFLNLSSFFFLILI